MAYRDYKIYYKKNGRVYFDKKATKEVHSYKGDAHLRKLLKWIEKYGDYTGRRDYFAKRIRLKSRGSQSRVNTKRKRETLYNWAWSLKGKGQISRIGRKMASLKRSGGVGSKKAIVQLGRIGDLKKAYQAGKSSCKKRRRYN